MKSLVTKLEKR